MHFNVVITRQRLFLVVLTFVILSAGAPPLRAGVEGPCSRVRTSVLPTDSHNFPLTQHSAIPPQFAQKQRDSGTPVRLRAGLRYSVPTALDC